MNVSLLVLGLCCLIGRVYPKYLPSAVEFNAVRNIDVNEDDHVVGGSATTTAGEFPYMGNDIALLSLTSSASSSKTIGLGVG